MKTKAFLLFALLALRLPLMAQDPTSTLSYNSQMINVLKTDGNDMTWTLYDVDDLEPKELRAFTQSVNELMTKGRYVEAVVPLNIGNQTTMVVVHRPNTENVKQLFQRYNGYEADKRTKQAVKYGWQIKMFTDDHSADNFVLYDKEPMVKKVEFVMPWKDKQKDKLKAEGYYFTAIDAGREYLAQKRSAVTEQVFASYEALKSQSVVNEKIAKMKELGYIVSSAYGFGTSFDAVFDKSSKAPSQTTLFFADRQELADFINSGLASQYTITAAWKALPDAFFQAAAEKRAADDVQRKQELENSGGTVWNAFGYFGQAIVSGAQMVSQAKNIGKSSSPTSTVSSGSYNPSSTSSKSKKGTGTSSSKTKQSNFAAYKNYDRAYDGYETQLVKMRSDGKYNIAEVRDIQQKMREIRQKIAELGFTRAVSDTETWNPAGRQ